MMVVSRDGNSANTVINGLTTNLRTGGFSGESKAATGGFSDFIFSSQWEEFLNASD